MPNIALKNKNDSKWESVPSVGYDDESTLRDLLVDDPKLLPLTEIGISGEHPIALKEFGLPGAGSSDVIIVDEHGSIAVVECKLATNQEKKRTVIGQVLDYASSLSSLDYDDFVARAELKLGVSLHSAISKSMSTPADFDGDTFSQALYEGLTSGSFSLVIAIDEMDDDLRRILDYVSARSNGSLHIFGLSLRYHQGGNFEAIVPDISNPHLATVRNQSVNRWTAERFSAAIQKADPGIQGSLSRLLSYLQSNATREYWGTSKSYGTFGFGVRIPNGRTMSLFTVYSNGTFYINKGTLQEQAPKQIAERFINSVAQIANMDRVVETKSYPQFQIKDTLAADNNLERFISAVDELVEEWK